MSLTLSLLSASSPAGQEPATVACVLDAEGSADEPATVSNLKPIHVDVLYDRSEPQLGQAVVIDSVEDLAGQEADNPRVLVEVYSRTDQKKLPVEILITAAAQRLQKHTLSLSIRIPIDESQKQAAILDFIRRALQARDETGLPKLPKRYYDDPPTGYFEMIFLQNRVGVFEIRCALDPGRGKKILTASPLAVEVRFDGNFFDQQQFKMPK